MVPTVSKSQEKSVNFKESGKVRENRQSGKSQGKFESTKMQKRKADEKIKNVFKVMKIYSFIVN